jgi:two-component system, LuxR family, sensor kinase FixL
MAGNGTFDPAQHAGGLLASLVDVCDEAVVATDLDGAIVSWNRGATRLYGYTAQEALGQSVAMLIPEVQRSALTGRYDRIRAGERLDTFETLRLTKNGDHVAVSATWTPVQDDTGRVIGALSIERDLRVEKRADLALQSAQARWRALLDSAVDAIVVIDARGRIEAVNRATERSFGYAERELLGRNVSVLMPSPYREEHDGYIARYERGGEPRIIGTGREVMGRRRDGSTFPLHLAVGEMQLDGERKFTGILHDLSDRVRMEERLREQAALAHLGEMAAVIAHEIKNPLAGIRGAVQVVAGRMPAGAPEVQVLGEVVARIDALGDLMKDLLLFARPPQLTRAAVPLRSVVAATADLLAADPALHAFRTEIHGDTPVVDADAGLLQIVFLNLFLNGAQAMAGVGTLDVSITTTDDVCAVAIQDRGPGIPADVREKVFTPFFTTKSRGTGLGLPTAKRFIEAHGGDMWLECPPDGGTVVTVQLPIAG